MVKGARPLVEHTKVCVCVCVCPAWEPDSVALLLLLPLCTQDEIVYDFAKTHGITRAEAKFYLDEADFNVVECAAWHPRNRPALRDCTCACL